MTRLPQTTLALLAVLGLLVAAPDPARATGFTDIGQDIRQQVETTLLLHGAFRTRFELLSNFDLDRGLTPSGEPLFPVPLSDPSGQLLTHGDMRLRMDLAAYAPGQGVAVKVRLDLLDNLTYGSVPDGVPSVTTSQRAPADAVHVERAYAEALTPVGLLAAGRMGQHFGLGMLANGGDCADCDSGDTADRVAFLTPLLGHVWAFAFDFTSSGPTTPRRGDRRAVDVDPHDDVRSVTFAVLEFRSEQARRRRARAGKVTLEYGAYVSHRWQDRDVPAHYLPAAQPVPITAAQSMARGFKATATSVWGRLSFPSGRVELEAALLRARIEQPSLVPGALLRDPLTSTQTGLALESDFGPLEGRFSAGFDGGYASGDPAPGFGAFPAVGDAFPAAGELDGPQADPGRDNRVDNFRFHPDYRVDRILFREIIGTVTDAIYLRPHARVTLFALGSGTLDLSLAAIASFAVEATSTPGGERPLGVELDPTLVYQSRDGLLVALEHAVLFPLAGLDNPGAGLSAQPAHLFRLRLGFFY